MQLRIKLLFIVETNAKISVSSFNRTKKIRRIFNKLQYHTAFFSLKLILNIFVRDYRIIKATATRGFKHQKRRNIALTVYCICSVSEHSMNITKKKQRTILYPISPSICFVHFNSIQLNTVRTMLSSFPRFLKHTDYI